MKYIVTLKTSIEFQYSDIVEIVKVYDSTNYEKRSSHL